jgi:molybdopterin-guanine dinucleotide biosynthesis protein B
VILTSKKSAIFLDKYLSVVDAVEMLGPLDIVVLEGFKSLDAVARILVPRNNKDVRILMNGLEIAISSPNYERLSIPKSSIPVIPIDRMGDIADLVESKTFPVLAGLDCGGCGFESCVNLAKAILNGEAKSKMCVKYRTNAIRLKVDERTVEVNPFVNKVMRNVVLGMIRTLNGGGNPQKIEISFDVGGEIIDK